MNTKTWSQQSPFSHLLITHSYLCSVLFTRSSKQVLMKTKGIRQAEDESPYTVKTTGATWWKEEAFSCFHQATLPESVFCLGWPTSNGVQPAQSSRAEPLSFHPATQSAKNRSFMIFFFKRLIRSEKQIIDHCRRSSKGALTHVVFHREKKC